MASTQGGFSQANATGMPAAATDAKNAYGMGRAEKNGPTAALNNRIGAQKGAVLIE